MRVLVEQTYGEAVKWLDRLRLLAGLADWTEPGADKLPTKRSQLKRGTNGEGRGYEPDPDATQSDGWASQHGDQGNYRIAVHLLLGGEEKSDWALWPERDAILVGTQDMLISRTLNRGYAAGRARWPLEFGLLNSDCLWVFDEIQIMDTGLATSLQLDAWRRSLHLRPSRHAFPTKNDKHLPKPCHSLWMSATMAKHWLERAVDWSPRVEAEWTGRHQLSDTERTDEQLRSGQLFQVEKQLRKASITPLEKPKTKDNRADKVDAERKQTEYLKRLADHISKPENHAASGLTLVIVNTVDRATKLFNLLRRQSGLEGVPIKLIHSRFRPYEREQWSSFLSQRDNSRRILISTQVVEAGVDLSAAVLYTELAPWASLVQRFGRCARYPGESGQVIWLDLDLGSDKQPVDHWARPYGRGELIAARERLNNLGSVGLQELSAIKAEIESEQTDERAADLFPYEPRFVPRDKDLFDLFDTTPDLSGADVDVSRYIRDGEELDVQVFWREIPSDREPTKKDRPHRRELCSVPFHRFQDFVRNALKGRRRIWRRRYSKGAKRTSSWELLDFGSVDQAVYPGQVFLLEKSCGGYSVELGWTDDPQHTDFELPPAIEAAKATAQDEEDDADDLSQIDQWLSVLDHTLHVCEKLEQILDPDGLTESETKVLRLATRWHDRGKAHPPFTAKFKPEFLVAADVQQKLGGQPPAKAPDGRDRNTGQVDESQNAWRRDKLRPEAAKTPAEQLDKRRPGHRHELASALAILETLYRGRPDHPAFVWEPELAQEFSYQHPDCSGALADDPLVKELAELSPDELDLLVYLVAAHHGKVRMSIRSAPDDERDGVPDPCPPDKRQARGIRDGDSLPQCQIPLADLNADGLAAPEVILSLDPMELGLSSRYGDSWRERMQLLLERLGPFRLSYLEALLRAADCRASAEEDAGGKEGN
jgi:CRISPR-associated endonuclease/helicase Cas3